MRNKKHRLLGLGQRLYITCGAFVSNDLFTYASAGAYSFLLSALPVLLMVLVILVRILHTSPAVIRSLMNSNKVIAGSINLSHFFRSIMSIKSVGIFEIILGLSIFWMARSFFASIQQCMTIIYRKRGKGKPVKENLVIFAGEVLLLILISAMTIFFIAGNTLIHTAFSEKLLSPFLYHLLKNLFRYVPLGSIFLFLFFVYYITPRTRPKASYSLIASALCTISFSLMQILFGSFVNMSKYNLVYGILSNVIVSLFDVYFFFFFFLFFAQLQYVIQFFESFLLARLYLMPDHDDPDPFRQIERLMFIEPPLFYRKYAIREKAGKTIFVMGDDSTELYYICKGMIRLNMPNQVIEIGSGRVFGEFSSIIGGKRTATAIALTNVTLLKIPEKIFQETIEVDGTISRRTLQMITDYVRKNNHVPLSEYHEV